mmetsp:Transcript_21023/g.30496  ORF Transcript_21023/g.30496 Transcript_21023/m.30496 type:complete len:136 (-) Transcript_21023:204-611(-)
MGVVAREDQRVLDSLHRDNLGDIQAQYEAAVAAFKEKMLVEISAKIKKIENLRDDVKEEQRMPMRNLRSKVRLEDLPPEMGGGLHASASTTGDHRGRSRGKGFINGSIQKTLAEAEATDDIRSILECENLEDLRS